MPEQQAKRRRVTRACDECRKKKVKCDGQQPCIHCTVYSYECTYKQPTKRSMSNQQLSSNTSNSSQLNPNAVTNSTSTRKYNTKNTKLQSQVSKYQQIFSELFPDLPDINTIDIPTFLQIFHNFKGTSPTFLDDVTKEYFLIANESTSPSQQSPKYSSPDSLANINFRNGSGTSINTLDSTLEQNDQYQSGAVGREIKIILPPKPIALQFVKNTWEHCCVLLRFYHRPSFIKQLDELYETDPHNYTSRQMQFLPLCYSTMAVGALFSKSIEEQNNDTNNRDPSSKVGTIAKNTFLQDEGYKYFIAARKLIDITNTRDLNSIQTVLMLFIFLQCSARLSTCYAYIGVAMRSAIREGFHRSVNLESGLNPIEIEMRKRLFFTIYKLDIYVNAMLGLPRSIAPEDFDQTLPLDLSDENITEEGYYPERQNGVLSSTGIANQHTKLLFILDSIIRELYPIKKTSNIISHETVTDLELQLREWVNELPAYLSPSLKNVPARYERANKLLHLSFLHVQIILYRPFIHYLSRNFTADIPDPLSLQRARNSISVARTVVKMAQEMLSKNLISGSYWYACYTIFYSVAGLLFYIHEADLPDKESAREYYEILKDAEIGRNVLIQLKDTSMAANRTYTILNKLFEKLNSKTIQLTSMNISPINKKATLVEAKNPLSISLSQDTKSLSNTSSTNNTEQNYSMDNFIENIPSLPAGNEASPASNISVTNMNSNFIDSSLKDIDSLSKGNNSEPPCRNDMFLKSENINPLNMFGLDGGQNEVIDIGAGGGKLETQPNVNQSDTDKIKLESLDDDDLGIMKVFDQLDAHIFGRYVAPNGNVTDSQNNPV